MGVLSPLWPGDFATLWRTPPAYPGKLPPGHGGEAVVWLADRLAAVDGGAAAQPGQRLDAALQARVQAFQQTQGLKADGVAGPTTLMLLNRASGVNEPPLDLRGS